MRLRSKSPGAEFMCGQSEVLYMAIVEEPSNYGFNYAHGQISQKTESNLKLRVQPANFSGPPHFKRLVGRCFSSVINDYKYQFCPFSNVIQHEQSITWNPYNGVLGVWQEWSVMNNKFVAMVMKDGERCGEIFRSVKVTFECGNTSVILNVTEPETCNYHMRFLTPLVCHVDAMLVYPTLTQELQLRWDIIEGEMDRNELTETGYKLRLAGVFETAGIYLTQSRHLDLLKQAEDVKREKINEGEFESLETCKVEFKRLLDRVNFLMSQMNYSTSTGVYTTGGMNLD